MFPVLGKSKFADKSTLGNDRFSSLNALIPLGAVLAGVALAPGKVMAQSAPANSEVTLPTVNVRDSAEGKDYAPATSTIGGKEPTAIRDIPQTVNVINRAVLDAQAATSMTEALRYVPGITISAGEGGAIGDNINLRGFSARTDIYLDGFRDRGQYTRDTFFLEAVEVLKGPSSMLFGRGSTGGVINQVSKKPNLTPHSEVTASVGTDAYYRSTLDINQPLSETSAMRVAAFGQNYQTARDVVVNKDFGVAPSLRLGIGTPTEITLSALIQHNNDIPDYGFPFVASNGATGAVRKPVDAPDNYFYGYTDDKFVQDVAIGSMVIRHKISPTLTLRNQLQYSQYQTDASPTPLGTVSRVGGGATPPNLTDPLSILNAKRQDKDREITDKSLFNQTELIAKIQSNDVLHTLTTGLEIGRDEYTEDRFAWNPTDVLINLGVPVNGTRGGQRRLGRTSETTADTLAAYANDQIDLDKQWKVVAGLRWERFETETSTNNITLPAGFTTVSSLPIPSHTENMLSPRAGVIYQPNDTASYYISYGVSYNPTAESVSASTTSAATAASYNLEAEKNRSIEIGAKLDYLDGNLSFNSALFQVEKTNARTADSTGEIHLDGDIQVRGVELGVVGRITPVWQILAGYTYLDSEIKKGAVGTGTDLGIPSTGKTYANTPRNQASLWSTYSFLGNWEAGGGLVYSSERYVNNFETAKVDGYTRADATIAYKQKAYDVRLNVQNLNDKRYFDVASGGRATLARGRTAIATVAYRF